MNCHPTECVLPFDNFQLYLEISLALAMGNNLATLILFTFILMACHAQYGDKINWSKGPAPNHTYEYNSAVSIGEKVYTIGDIHSGAFEVFDPKAGSWTSLPSCPTPRVFAGGAHLNNIIYVVGGIDIDTGFQYSTVVEKFNLAENKWSTSIGLHTPRSRLVVVACDGKLYAIGGLAGTDDKHSKNVSTMEVYDPITNAWMQGLDMPTARHGHAAVVLDGKILVVGGYTDAGPTGAVEQYDPKTDQWTKRSAMPTARGFFGLVTTGGYVYAIGGRITQDHGPVERFENGQNIWKVLEPMPESKNRFGVAAIGHHIYIIGGEQTPKSFLIGEITTD